MENGNKPAYPISEEQTDRIDSNVKIYSGLTKREYFAAMAMQGLLSIYSPQGLIYPNEENINYMTELSVKSADALLQKLDQKQPSTSQ